MNRLTIKKLCSIFLLISGISYAQVNNKCAENIDFLINTLEAKSPSYKHLIIDKNDFIATADSIKMSAIKDENPYNCKAYLQKIMRHIQDGHIQILVKNDIDYRDSLSVRKFQNSEKFNSLKTVNIDSLISTNTHQKSNFNALNDDLNIEIFQIDPNYFEGYIKKSNSEFWRKGELVLKYWNVENFHEGVIYNRLKDPNYFKTSTVNELFKKFNLTKFQREACEIFNRSNEKLSIQIIDDEILYVSIRSFKNGTIEENNEFINFFENSVLPNYESYKNIVFDVRDNSGGAMAYETLLRGIKKNKALKNIYVLQNRNTASAAELFILHLSKIKKVKTVGENTRGMVAFRDIYQAPFPHNDYVIFLPTKVFDKNYEDLLQYEFVGLSADFELDENDNWLNKTIEIVKKNGH